MQIRFHGKHTTDEAIENLVAMFQLFRQRYSVVQFDEMQLELNLMNELGEPVELVDLSTSEILQTLEVYKSSPHDPKFSQPPDPRKNKNSSGSSVPRKHKQAANQPDYLKLVVDNSKKSKTDNS